MSKWPKLARWVTVDFDDRPQAPLILFERRCPAGGVRFFNSIHATILPGNVGTRDPLRPQARYQDPSVHTE